ncbi:hypothetical protein [Streptomyces sp. FH025]|uniref:hypothetical protein n=1 Tax=Streptomyces sp. FH025 TaxID=2815937 RepID=UPI001A9D75D8|nr:hypothetical protein [Streptomyces sp. FH025]MBO1418396.1 hypothetical protein [Streptomyces sp. FH025]
MTLIKYNSVLDVIHERVTTAAHLRPTVLTVKVGDKTVHLDLPQARAALWERPVDGELSREVWRQAVTLAQHDTLAAAIGSTDVTGWVEAVVWLALPRLQRIARQASSRLRAERRDVESELMVAVVEELAAVSPDDPDVGGRLLRAAARQGWAFARGTANERPSEDVVEIADARGAKAIDDLWELVITPPDRSDGLAAPLRFSSRSEIEAARLGQLADHLGLHEVIRHPRRPLRGARVGTLSLCATGRAR